MTVARPKVRSRKGGSAVPLDETDKRLMNTLQSQFPLAAEPFTAVAAAVELPVEEVMERTRRLLDERIIREITPIFAARCGFSSSTRAATSIDS